MLARPHSTVTVGAGDAVDRVMEAIQTLAREEDGVTQIVVGWPTRLNGEPTEQTARVARFIDALRTRTDIPIATEGEQLSSREAESRLALNEKDWRRRKAQLDSAAAAIILQDYLDRHAQ